jgi:NAD(P)-dependent dehydrogenase (short-subunit alcohol dehydrogenase family)
MRAMASSGNTPRNGRVPIITGTGRGIGRATALLLAARGDRVMGVARSQDELASLADEAPIEVLSETVATQEGCERIVRETRERLGPISILVNNAGLGSYQEAVIWEQDPASWRASLAVNLDAAFHLIRLSAPDMVEASWGRIVIVSSTAGQVGAPAIAAYTAAKHGVIGLMRSAAQDLIPYGVTCNAVCPGWVKTAMADADAETQARMTGRTAEEVWEANARSYAAERVMQPEEIADVIGYLTSDGATALNGEAITVALGGLW